MTDAPDPRRWKALAVCLVAGFMTLLDVSIVNVALPSIESGLGAGKDALQWVVSGYALAFGLLLVPAGRLGDARGRRRAFLLGLVLFTGASAACGLATDPALLVVFRLVQGLAGGILSPQVSGLIQQLFQGAERARAFGLLGASIGLSTAVGPLLGGVLISAAGTDHGWRLVFFVNLPVGIAALLLARRLLPEDRVRERAREDLDPVGVVLLGLGVTAVLLPLVEQQQWGRTGLLTLLPVAAVLLLAWVLWERRYADRGQAPVVDLDLLTERSYALGAGVAMVYFAGFTGIFFTYTQYLQIGLHHSALAAGLAVTPFAVGSAAAAALGGRVVTKLGRPLVVGGLLLVVLGFVGTWVAARLVPGQHVLWATAVPLLAAGVGSGLVITPNITITLQDVPVRRAGTAGGVLQTAQRVGAAAGIAATGYVFYDSLARARGDWAVAFRDSLWVTTGFTVLALLMAVGDVVLGPARQAPTARAASTSP